MTVTSTALNAEKTVGKCLHSVGRQTFKDHTHILVDAASTDRTLLQAQMQSVGRKNVEIRTNTIRKAALENVWEIWQTLPDDEVIVWLDGDDWLAHDQALQVVADAYNHPTEPMADLRPVHVR